MTKYTLTVLDTSQIQRYVFGSNRLLENVGASELVERASRQWVWDTLNQLYPGKHNVDIKNNEIIDQRIDRDRLAAEVVYAGGGNTVILFETHPQAVELVQKLTRKVIQEAPGLQITAIHEDFEWNPSDKNLITALNKALSQTLPHKKATHVPSMPLLSLGVTAACNSTGLVATHLKSFIDEDNEPLVTTEDQTERRLIATEIEKKRAASRHAKHRFRDMLKPLSNRDWEIPDDLDYLGRERGEESYIAIVHADGNGMGRRFQQVGEKATDDRDYILKIRELSGAVRLAANMAMTETMKLLWGALEIDPTLPYYTKDDKKGDKKENKYYFPLRPIVFGGDDTTFVCNGMYGLPLAIKYLETFEQATHQHPAFGGQGATARAGVAVVKVHYPFARAYQLSENLAGSAKKYLRDKGGVSALDWHFAVSGITGTLEDIRRREYTSRAGLPLYMRPVLLHDNAADWQTWPTVRGLIHEFEKQGWRDSRNKVITLRDVLRRGQDDVREFVRAYRLPGQRLPGIKNVAIGGDYAKSGYIGDICVYFDAIEALDFYRNLEEIVREGRGA